MAPDPRSNLRWKK